MDSQAMVCSDLWFMVMGRKLKGFKIRNPDQGVRNPILRSGSIRQRHQDPEDLSSESMIRSPEEHCRRVETAYRQSGILLGMIRSPLHNQDPIKHEHQDPEGHSVIMNDVLGDRNSIVRTGFIQTRQQESFRLLCECVMRNKNAVRQRSTVYGAPPSPSKAAVMAVADQLHGDAIDDPVHLQQPPAVDGDNATATTAAVIGVLPSGRATVGEHPVGQSEPPILLVTSRQSQIW
ncbi:hypothetical protein ACLOJK_038421 [Asimina triloba]